MRIGILAIVGIALITLALYIAQSQDGELQAVQLQTAEPLSQPWQLYESMVSQITPTLKAFGLLLFTVFLAALLAVSMAKVQVTSVVREQAPESPGNSSVVEKLMSLGADAPEYLAALLKYPHQDNGDGKNE